MPVKQENRGTPDGGGRSVPLTVAVVVLAAGTGALDVACFTRLGEVFCSVMTANVVFLGLAAARSSARLATYAGIALAGYVAGAALGTWVAGRSGERADTWTVKVSVLLLVELVVLGGFAAGWGLVAGRPGEWQRYVLLATATPAMGMQSAAVRRFGAAVSTTYLTGTLTGVVATVVGRGRPGHTELRGLGVLGGAVGGAALGGALLLTAPAWLPVLPCAAVACTLLLAVPHRRRGGAGLSRRHGG